MTVLLRLINFVAIDSFNIASKIKAEIINKKEA